MTTKQVAEAANVSPQTVRNYARYLDGKNVGGCHGYEFPDKALMWLLDHLDKKNRPRRNSLFSDFTNGVK